MAAAPRRMGRVQKPLPNGRGDGGTGQKIDHPEVDDVVHSSAFRRGPVTHATRSLLGLAHKVHYYRPNKRRKPFARRVGWNGGRNGRIPVEVGRELPKPGTEIMPKTVRTSWT